MTLPVADILEWIPCGRDGPEPEMARVLVQGSRRQEIQTQKETEGPDPV